jgi:hypothetical protein
MPLCWSVCPSELRLRFRSESKSSLDFHGTLYGCWPQTRMRVRRVHELLDSLETWSKSRCIFVSDQNSRVSFRGLRRLDGRHNMQCQVDLNKDQFFPNWIKVAKFFLLSHCQSLKAWRLPQTNLANLHWEIKRRGRYISTKPNLISL